MTQEERWNKRYQDVMEFMEKNHRNPSRNRLEEHDMLNWVKANRKKMNAGKLLELYEEYKRKNQYYLRTM